MSQHYIFLVRLYTANLVYWVVAIVGLVTRYFVDEIRALTQYGGRIAPTSSSLMPSGTTDVDDMVDGDGEDAESGGETDEKAGATNVSAKESKDPLSRGNAAEQPSSAQYSTTTSSKTESKNKNNSTDSTSTSSKGTSRSSGNSKRPRHPMIVMSDGTLRRLDWCPVALQPLVANTINTLLGLMRAIARMIGNSFFGRTRIPRSDAFAVFYLFGLLGCMLMWKWTPALPCKDVAARSVRAYFIRTENLYDAVSMDRMTVGNETDLQELTRVLHGHELNPEAVEQRFWYEVSSCIDEVAPMYYVENFPLMMFLLHCVIRLVECFYVHVFRCGSTDTVNFFSFLAGCSFYLMAAVCSSFTLWQILRDDVYTDTLVHEGLLPSWWNLPNASLYLHQVKETVNASEIELFSEWRARKQSIFRNTTYAGFPASLVPRRIPLPWYLSILEMVANEVSILVPHTVVIFFFVLYLAVQIVQTGHHEILAQQRRCVVNKGARNRAINARITHTASIVHALEVELAKHEITAARVVQHGDAGDVHLLDSTTSRDNDDNNNGDSSNARPAREPTQPRPTSVLPKPERTTGTDARVLRYHLPSSLLFRWLLEPHYTCEIILYAINVVVMLVLVLFNACVVRGATAADFRVLPLYRVSQSSATADATAFSSSSASQLQNRAVYVLFLHLVTCCGVTLFTLFNLAITSQEHRSFWNYVNDERETISALVAADVAPAMVSADEKPEKAVDEMKAVEATKRRQQLEFVRVLRPEILPSSNLFPGIW